MPGSSMSQREVARAWHAILGRLEFEMSATSFETWLRGTRAISFEGGTLVAAAPRALACTWLNEKMEHIIQRIASQVLGEPVAVHFQPEGARVEASGPLFERPPATPAQGRLIGRINREHTVERYVAFNGNCTALEACRRLVESPSARITPVVVYGAPGLGKTHLLHAVARQALDAGWTVACLGAEEFTTRYIGALRRGEVEEVQGEVRRCRLLVLDDLQYLATRRATLDELVHTLDSIAADGGSAVIASERDPRELGLPERLASRLLAGFVTRIAPFGREERQRFIRREVETHGVELPEWVLERIANCEVPSVRVLQGALHAAVMLSRTGQLDYANLDAQLTLVALSLTTAAQASPHALVERVARHFSLQFEEVSGRSRKPAVTRARAVAVALLRDSGASWGEIARILGGRDRSTVADLIERGHELLAEDPSLRALAS